ncbi:tautomerase family protein [Serratia ureilytica]
MTIDQIARAMGSDAEQQQFLAGCTRILQPYLAARGCTWAKRRSRCGLSKV